MLGGVLISLLGGGVMGEAITSSLLHGLHVTPDQITIAEPITERRDTLIQRYNVHATASNAEAARAADILVLSVKPQAMASALGDIRGVLRPEALIVSIAAGVPIFTIVEHLQAPWPIVRVMPNTPAQIGQGISVWTSTPNVNRVQLEQARLILSGMGQEIYVESENYLDMATALSGTGPAYVFLFMEALIDAGVHMGFSRSISERLVEQTLKGSVEYAIQSRRHVAELRNQVTSPAGTTAAALYQLEKGGLRHIISRAVWAAYERSVALGRIAKGDK